MSTSADVRDVTKAAEGSLARLSDEELLLKYRRGHDRRVFALIVRRYERELYNYLRRFLDDDALAEDSFQGTFLQLHLKAHQFEAGRRLKPWLYTIATNQAIDARRRTRRHRLVSLDRGRSQMTETDPGRLTDVLASDEPTPLTRLDEQERARWVRTAIADLPEALQQVIHLVYYQGLKYREAAEELSIPVGTVKSRIHTAVCRLHVAWKAAHDGPHEHE